MNGGKERIYAKEKITILIIENKTCMDPDFFSRGRGGVRGIMFAGGGGPKSILVNLLHEFNQFQFSSEERRRGI